MTLVLDSGGITALAGQRARLAELRRRGLWPAQVPDQLNHAPDWTSKCAAAQKDWRKIDLIFP